MEEELTVVFVVPAFVVPASLDLASGLVADALARVNGASHHFPHRYHLLMTLEAIVAPICCSLDGVILLLTVDYALMVYHRAQILCHLTWSHFDVSSDLAVSD